MTKLARLPLLIVNDPRQAGDADVETLQALAPELNALGIETLNAADLARASVDLETNPALGGILIVWDHDGAERLDHLESFVSGVRRTNEHIPLFVLTRRLGIENFPAGLHSKLTGCIWVGEDDTDFVAGHLSTAMAHYRHEVLPPFFRELLAYVAEAKYSWHTPGHMGGVAFLKSPAGRIFHDFFGENVLRADLSSSVPELGSVLEHEGVVAEAERAAARTFGADETYFVTNGTTMSNQIIFRATVSPGDVVLLDRNCHKSIVNSVIQTGAIPIYMSPLRNQHGMIGPIDPAELEASRIRGKLRDHPLIGDATRPIRLAVVTNSTYDGTMYDVGTVLDQLSDQVEYILFDEAWVPYAAFHPIYSGRFAMSQQGREGAPTVFSTMSTHKMLAAFSQASMIHIRQGRTPVPREIFNEAFMMHTSTSPQYSIIASLDVATKMMEGAAGHELMDATVHEAMSFRDEISRITPPGDSPENWWFQPWQPAGWTESVSSSWSLGASWSGFDDLTDDYAMLDPTKVSLLCPGVNPDGTAQDFGVPASLVSTLLRELGVVSEKTGFYSLLFLFSIGVTRGKSATLVEALLRVKQQINDNVPVEVALPSLCADHPDRYRNLGVADLAKQMHAQLAKANTSEMQEAIYRVLPQPVLTPGAAFDALIRGHVDQVPVDKLDGHISAVLCVLYPPGIPVVMPGERFTTEVHPVTEYLALFEHWDTQFPGFETELQGVVKHTAMDGRLQYTIPCVHE